MALQPVLINNQWRAAASSSSFQAINPATCETLEAEFPVSDWSDCEAALDAAVTAAAALRQLPGEKIAQFLERFAERLEQRKDQIVATAHEETALPVSPRLADGELPRTTGQLRQAAAAARDQSWATPTIDSAANIRSMLGPIGPVCVFGPNNFPFAFGSISGGDFAAAIAAGNPVIAKANTSHPATTRLLAEEAQAAAVDTNMPPATVQMIYLTSHADGERLVADPRVGATGYTGSRHAGLALKAAADAAGKPIYLELSSVNPVVMLPGALTERGDKLVEEFTGSCLMGTGQFCTNPGLVVLFESDEAETFIAATAEKFKTAPVGTLLSAAVAKSLPAAISELQLAGAHVVVGAQHGEEGRCCYANTLLRATGAEFLANPAAMQTEAFGNASLIVVAANADEAGRILDRLEGNLTGCIYSHTAGDDDPLYDELAPRLRLRVGRLLNDQMPTGVAVSAAMNHGGPYPATGHPGFTAVGIPASLRRFAGLECYDNVRPHRLPAVLRNENPTAGSWRLIDGAWTQAHLRQLVA